MLDTQVFTLLRQWVMVEAPKRGATLPAMQLRYQPQHMGRNNERTVYMHVVGYRRIGQRKVAATPDGVDPMVRTETQSMETTIQFSITQPAELDDSALTHGDVLNIVAATVQSDDAVKFFISQGMSVLRVGEVRNSYWNNDRDQNEPNPTFDLVCKHNNIFVDGVPYITKFTFEAFPVPDLA